MFNRPLALLLLIALSPIFLIIIILIMLEDGFPVFFKQKRVGINYTFFWIYKFRSMKKDTPNVATHLLENTNSYLLKTGKLIRKYSLDELPNLLNIIKGDMVFVGPRPALYNQDDLMQLRIKAGVDKLKSGLTGWAQINGRDETPIDVASIAKPLIAIDLPSCREVVKHNVNEFLCKVKNSQSLVDSIKRFIELDVSKKIEM